MLRKQTKGFSLLELMVVITIIAFLTAAGMPSYIKYLQRASIMEAVTVLGSYKTALGIFWSVQGKLPGPGDILTSTPMDLPFNIQVTGTTTNPLPSSIQSLLLSSSGNGILITAVIQGGVFSTFVANNRTLVLGVKSIGNELQFACGNFTPNATAITDVGFTDITVLPNGCNYNGVSTWLNT